MDAKANIFFEKLSSKMREDQIGRQDGASVYENNTVAHHKQVRGVVFPESEDEIIHIVRCAREEKVSLYPISKGHNWGYGGRTPHVDGCVVVDLGRMNRILDFQREEGVVTLEPGVTHAQLHDYLVANNLAFMVPVIGAGPQASLLGNALERGFGLTPIMDHFSAVMSLRAILADGSLYHSALYTPDTTCLHGRFKWGVGPYLDGLFTQSNMGIVTQMSIRLEKKKEELIFFAFNIQEEDLESAVSLIKEITMDYKTLLGSVLLLNQARVNVSLKIDGKSALIGENDWIIMGSIYGSRRLANCIKKDIQKRFKKQCSRQRFLSRRMIRFIKSISATSLFHMLPSSARVQIENLLTIYAMMEGAPTEQFLHNIAYTKASLVKGKPLNPDDDNVGLFWFAPLVPCDKNDVKMFIDICREVFKKHGFIYTVSFASFSHLCFDATLPIFFKKDDPDETARARACYGELMTRCSEYGFLPYRVGLQGMDYITTQNPAFWDVVTKIKDALDPGHLLSPGRYCPMRKER